MLIKNAAKRDKQLTFDEKLHKYYCNGIELESVTTWIGNYFCEPFTKGDKHLYISNVSATKNKKNGTGITNPEELRKYWNLQGQRSAANGTAAHTFIEMFHIQRKYGIDLEPKTGYETAIKAAYLELIRYWDIVEIEKQVYSTEYKLAGHLDMLIKKKKTGEYGILDWKTIEDMFKEHGSMLNEMYKYKDTPINKVSVQLEIYTRLLNLDIPSENRFAIQLRADGTFVVFKGTKEKQEIKKGIPNNNLINCSTEIDNALKERIDIQEYILNKL